jgi:hypothetical protein
MFFWSVLWSLPCFFQHCLNSSIYSRIVSILLARDQSREPKPKVRTLFPNPRVVCSLDSPLTCTVSNPSFQRSNRSGVCFRLLFVLVVYSSLRNKLNRLPEQPVLKIRLSLHASVEHSSHKSLRKTKTYQSSGSSSSTTALALFCLGSLSAAIVQISVEWY